MKYSLLSGLHAKVAGGVIGTVMLLSVVYILVDYRSYRLQALEELEHSSTQVSRVSLEAILEIAMMGRHPELLQKAFQSLASDPSVVGLDLMDLGGVIRFSSDADRVGLMRHRNEEGCVVCHTEDQTPPPVSAYYVRDGHEVLRNAIAVPNRVECHVCHDAEARLRGMLLVDYRPDRVHEQFRTTVTRLAWQGGLAVLAILLVLGALMNTLVIGRVRSLAVVAERLREGDFEGRVEVRGRDELGMLGQTLNEMARGLARYRRQAEEKEEIRVALLRKLVHAQEEERKTVARELHDQLGQSLSAILLSLEQKRSGGDGRSLDAEITERIRDTIGQVHDLARGIRPPVLDEYGLESALEQLIADVARESGIAIDYEHSSGGSGRMPDEVELALYRIAQEALTNVVRHAGAEQASVVLLRQAREVTLLVEDRGAGFQVGRRHSGGLGLTGIRERVSLLGGDCTIVSAPGEGTTIRVRVPLGKE